MGISRYNSEGYFDPVPQMAVAAIEKEAKEELHKWRPLVYICSPFSGDIEGNTEKARKYSVTILTAKRRQRTRHVRPEKGTGKLSDKFP